MHARDLREPFRQDAAPENRGLNENWRKNSPSPLVRTAQKPEKQRGNEKDHHRVESWGSGSRLELIAARTTRASSVDSTGLVRMV